MPRRKSPDSILSELEKRIANSELLSDEEKRATLAKAKEHVAEQRKKEAMEALLREAIKSEENAYDPGEEMVEWTVDLPEYSPCIRINDNRQYFHGVTYEVPLKDFRSLIDLQWQANCHQREIDGHRRQGDLQRRPLYTNLSPHNPSGRVSTTKSMRV